MNPKYEQVLLQIANSIRHYYGIEVDTAMVRGCEFFPECKTVIHGGETSRLIRFNPKVETVLALYNRAIEHGQEIGETVTRYALFHAFLELDDYEGARRHLQAFRDEVSRLKLTKRTAEAREDASNRILLQVYFTLLHESFHLIFNHAPELKASAMETTRELLGDMKDELEHQLSTITPDELLSHPKTQEQIEALIPSELPQEMREGMRKQMLAEMGQHPYSTAYYDELISGSDESLLEELSCDRQAWLNFCTMAEGDGCTAEDLLQFHLWFYTVFCAMDFNHHLLSQYRPVVHDGYTYDGSRIVLRHGAFKALLRQYHPEVYRLTKGHYLDRHKGLASIFRTATVGIFKYMDDFVRLRELHASGTHLPDFRQIQQLESEMAEVASKL